MTILPFQLDFVSERAASRDDNPMADAAVKRCRQVPRR